MSANPFRAREAVECITNAFAVFNGKYAQFKPKPVSFPVISGSFHVLKDIVKRMFPRFPKLTYLGKTFILSAPELPSFVHLPTKVEIAKIRYGFTAQLHLPSLNERHRRGVQISCLKYRGKALESVGIPFEDLTRHIYVIGATGTGKSSLLINMIAQALDRGLCVHIIDPHGDMSHDLVEALGRERLQSIVFLDPLRVRFSLNPLQLPPYRNRHEREMSVERIIGQMVEVMKRIFGRCYWGPVLNSTFQNVIRLLYLRDDSPTFMDISDVLRNEIERLGALALDPRFREFQRVIGELPYERLDAVMNKIDPFVKNAFLRAIFCTKRSTISFDKLMQPGKVVIWRLEGRPDRAQHADHRLNHHHKPVVSLRRAAQRGESPDPAGDG